MKLRIVVLFIFFNCPQIWAQDTTKILFIGNSLTYTNDLPQLVEKEAGSRGISCTTAMIAKPNYALIDHWNEGKVQTAIKSGTYDFVIVQQGPSSQPEGRRMLIEDGKRLAAICEANGARLCFLMVWPSLNYYSSFDGVIESHRLAAQANKAILIPVGMVWKEHFEATGKYDYYGLDGFHPSLVGSKVTAKVIVDTLFK